jgi:hypothetical protein
MRTIYKYNLELGTIIHNLPYGWVVRHAGPDPIGNACVWVELDNAAGVITESVTFIVRGTGSAVGDKDSFVGTFLDGMFVWHVYWRWS